MGTNLPGASDDAVGAVMGDHRDIFAREGEFEHLSHGGAVIDDEQGPGHDGSSYALTQTGRRPASDMRASRDDPLAQT
ncbi:MAG: hypothetical protein U0325_14470 [Polyangiales bacterium]